jgi:hypothetical protein
MDTAAIADSTSLLGVLGKAAEAATDRFSCANAFGMTATQVRVTHRGLPGEAVLVELRAVTDLERAGYIAPTPLFRTKQIGHGVQFELTRRGVEEHQRLKNQP